MDNPLVIWVESKATKGRPVIKNVSCDLRDSTSAIVIYTANKRKERDKCKSRNLHCVNARKLCPVLAFILQGAIDTVSHWRGHYLFSLALW